MDDNELDRLFGYDGGPEGTDADDPEHLQIVDSKDRKAVPAEKGSPDEKTDGDDSGKDKKESGSEDIEPSVEEGPGQNSEPKPEEDKDKETSESGKEEEKNGEDKEGEKEEKHEAEPSKPHAEKPSGERGKEKKKAKKPRRKLSRFGIGVIVFILIFTTLVLLFLFLPIFRVRSVTIEGNVELSDQEVLEEVGLKYNAHLMSGVSGNLLDILSFNYGKTEERIRKENPYISDISISIKIPSEVRITVKERVKIAYVSTPDGYIALDRYGTVLELDSGKTKRKVSPVVYGISVDSAKLGEKVVVRDENAYKKAIVVLGAILSADNATIGDDFNMFEHTTEVRIIPSGYIFLTIYTASGKPVQVKLNKTDKINDKMAKLLYLFNSKAFDKVTIKGTLDMTGDEFIFNASSG